MLPAEDFFIGKMTLNSGWGVKTCDLYNNKNNDCNVNGIEFSNLNR